MRSEREITVLDVIVIGGGMIVHDQILPSLYHLQRCGQLGQIHICATSTARTRRLADSAAFAEAFPGQSFTAHPALDTPEAAREPALYESLLPQMPPGSLVVVAVPDPLHREVILAALVHDHHVLAVKPLVPTYDEAERIREEAWQRGLFVGIEYHKRFDRRALEARRHYRAGRFGEFRCGEAKMIEAYAYRYSNFQNWFTKENTDPFTYVGCHYVDQVYFITGLRPTEVSVVGIEGTFPNGTVSWLWANGRVVWENGAVLSVINGLGYPDRAAGVNEQCLRLFCEGRDGAAVIEHDDHYRGVGHGYIDEKDGAAYRFVNPDYFRLVPYDGVGLRPVGYGYESIEALVGAALRVRRAGDGADDPVKARRAVLEEIDHQGLLATPANSAINELVTEAARRSISAGGLPVSIQYEPRPHVRWREEVHGRTS